MPRMYALLLGSLAVLALAEEASPRSFIVDSKPVRLRYGEVYNEMQPVMSLPQEVISEYADGKKAMAITGFDVDMLRKLPNGSEERVKLNDHYLHHYILSLGEESTMKRILKEADEDAMFARMLRGCHGMQRSATHSFLNKLKAESKSSLRTDFTTLGSAAGAEYRDNPQRFDRPYRAILWKPSAWAPVLHIINTKGGQHPGLEYSPLLECPCTPQRKINVTAGTIDGKKPDPPIHCSPEFAATGNPSCHLSTYQGGWRCCEHHMFLIDTAKECRTPDCSEEPQDEVFMRYKFYYEDSQPSFMSIESAACCDVTGRGQGDENIEYDVPACPAGTAPEKCLHIAETVQPVAYYNNHPRSPLDVHKGSDLVDLVFAAPHMHVAGLSAQLFDNVSGKLLCEVHSNQNNTGGISYGQGDTVGDERGYLVGLSTCKWGGGKAPRLRRDHPLRTRMVYNASRTHTGVMGLWLMDVAAVGEPDLLV